MLPFESIEEASMSLGRNLTFGETLWFNYTADKSDFYLYCHNTIFLIIFYSLVPLPMVMIELLRKVLMTFVFAVGPLQLFSYPIIEWVGIRTSLPLPSASEVFWQLVVYFVVEDYANYWLHRMLHHYKWGYDKIHSVHHEYVAPISFAAPYAHWAEIIILGLASFLGPLLVPCHMFTFLLWFVLRQIEAIETHSGYEFPWSPSKYIPFYGGAIYHDYHHFVGESCHSNFASVFTYCDYIYGTDKGFRYQKEVFEKRREKLRMEEKVNGSAPLFKSE
ncbi:hypothetical protein KY290_002178 [Solanum tuberosum]|uniref:Fatty acid hydroxylase domain-containing protein n=1 Tax=Solanum tuberosum TaxID=4113 RepID=A0ABQ7WRJ6_SOLTU|nr:hypothetical protein KY284_002223 [Solanum tuberosum]KAH0782580.1 hypothetical protein KY290_002178 [Solanum tuberosum]